MAEQYLSYVTNDEKNNYNYYSDKQNIIGIIDTG